MRVVIDPNVLVSAVVAEGVSAQLIDRWFVDRPFEIVICPHLIDELDDVLGRDKFRRWLTVEEARQFIDRLETESDGWPDPVDVPAVTQDPKDDYLVALFRDSDADLLVSGDSDLLAVSADNLPVVTPSGLLDRL